MKPYGGPASCDHVYHILTLSGTDLLRLHRIRFFFFFHFVLQALFFDFLLLLENVQGKCLRRSLSFCLFVEFIFSFRICFTGAVEMSRKSPFASWLCAMLHCFGSYILADLLLGEAPIHYFSNNSSVILATAIW